MSPLHRPYVHRCGPCRDFAVARASTPRGVVGVEDVRELQIDLTISAPDGPYRVELRAGPDVLYARSFEPVEFATMIPVPYHVQHDVDGLRRELRWTLRTPDGREAMTSFWVEPLPAETRLVLRRIDTETVGRPLWQRRVLRAQALHDAEFDLAARREARRVLAGKRREPHALAILHRASRFLGFPCDAYELGAEEILPIYDARRERGPRCDLDRPPEKRRWRLPLPRGGCGGPRD